MIIKEMPEEDRPREKLMNFGSNALSNKELLQVIIGKGCKDIGIIELVNEVYSLINNVSELKNLTFDELNNIKGIGQAKALQILASIELGVRIAEYKKERIKLLTPNDIYNFFYPLLKYEDQEVLYAVFYDIKGNYITHKLLTKGTINSTIIDSNMIFKWCYRLSSRHFIIIHNHPSGDATPSNQDLYFTKELIEQSKVLNLYFMDHIIIGDNYYSLKQKSLLKF